MSRIRSKNTLVEKAIFRSLRANKIHFTPHYSKLPGKPDAVFIRKKKVIFIDGDFWHGWNFTERESRLSEKWNIKIRSNIRRDKRTRSLLKRNGWSVLRIWEHEIEKDLNGSFQRIVSFINED